MSENTFDTEEISLNLQPLPAYIDSDGSFKLNTPMLSSFNFDGSIPKFEGEINAGDIKPGYLIQIETGGEYYPVVSIEIEEADMEDSPSGIVTINYVDDQGDTVSIDYEETDQVSVVYEDWDDKVIGSQGWGITAGGNAIFTNVGVRGEIEATTMDIGGATGITYDGTNVIIGASVTINAPVTFNGSGSFVTFNDLSASYALTSFVNTLNNRMSASLSSVSSSVSRLVVNNNTLTASINFLYNAGFVTDSDLITTGQTFINGNNITTGVVNANLVRVESAPLTASAGFKINSLGIFGYNQVNQETFRVESTTGNVFIRGEVRATSGFFGDPTRGISLTDNGTDVSLSMDVLKIKSTRTGGTIFGTIDFYQRNGTYIGSVTTASSQKLFNIGDGLFFGTSNDYLFLPETNNPTRARYRGSGFEWLNTSNQVIMSIAGGTGGLKVQNNTGGIQVSGGGNIEVTGTGRFIGDGSGLTNLPGGGGGGVTEIKFGDNQLWRSGRVYIPSASIVSAIDPGDIGNGKLANSTIQIMSTTKSLGQAFVAGEINGEVITANTLPPGRISQDSNLFTLGGTGVIRGTPVTTITGPLTIGTLTVSNSLDYVTNLGTSPVNLNRAANPMTLNGVRTASATIANTLRNLPLIEGLSGQGVIVHSLGGFLGALNYTATEANRFLQVNSAGTSLQWATFSGMTNPMTAFGDLIYGGTSGVPTRLAAGTSGQFLRTNGAAAPTWTSSIPDLTVSNAQGLSYVMNMGTSAVNLNRASGTMTLSGVTVDGLSAGTALFTLGTTAFTRTTTAITTIGGGITLGGGPTLQSGTTGMTFTIQQTGTGQNVVVDATTGQVRRNTSSIKYKKNIENYIPDENKIFDLRPVLYHFNSQEDSDIKQVGYIAEEVENLGLKEYVLYNNGEPDALSYANMIPAVIYLIKKQKEIIENLNNKINNLEARLDAAGL